MRRLAAVMSSLALLAACSGSSTPSDPQRAIEEARESLLRRMPSGSNLLFISVGGEGAGQVTTPDATLSWLRDDTFEKSDVTGAYWAYVAPGTTITLTATVAASATNAFAGWFGGSCSGTGTCQVTMGENVDVGAVFDLVGVAADPTRALLTVVPTGSGAGTVTGGGITCTSGTTRCSTMMNVTQPPQTVTLHAVANGGSIFQGWSGSCGGTGDCVVTMDSARSVYATFTPSVLTVLVQVEGDGTGTVRGPNGFTCSSRSGCTLSVPNTSPATQVLLTAEPASTFIVWSAQCSGWGTTCNLTVNDNRSVVATFGPLSNHEATLGSGDILVFAEGNTDHSGGFTMVESCTLCHYSNVATQHARNCDLCHAGSRPAQDLIGVWNKTCSQASCHPSMHTANTGSDHFRMWQNSSSACDRCHDTSSGNFPGPGDNCARCHAPSLTAAAVGDHQPPVTTSNALPSYVGGSIIHLSAADVGTSGVSVTWFSLDGREWVLGTDVGFSAPASGTRAHSLQFYSVDHAMNAEAVKSVAFTVQAIPAPDTTPPVTTSSFNPAAGAIYRVSQGVILNAIDTGSGVSATYHRIDANPFVQGSSFTVAGDGLHTFSYYSVDVANNTEAIHTSNPFRIDTIAPVTNCNAVGGTTYTGAQSFTLAATDAGSGVASTRYSLDAGAFITGTSVAVPAPASGTASHTIQWYSLDVAGNQEATRSVTFTVQASAPTDTTAPVTTCSAVGGTTYTGAQVFTLAATDAGSGVASTWYRLDGSGAAPFTQGTSVSVAAPASGSASHTVFWYSIDVANNTETTKSVTFTVQAAAASHGTQTWATSGSYPFTIPAGVTSLSIDALGGGGQGGTPDSPGTGAAGGSASITYGPLLMGAGGGYGGGCAYNTSQNQPGGNGGSASCSGSSACSSLVMTNGAAGESGWDDGAGGGFGGAGGAPNGMNGADAVEEWLGGSGGGGGGARIQGTWTVTPGGTVTIVIQSGSSVTLTW